MKNYGFIQRLSDSFPYERRTPGAWLLPASLGVGLGVALGLGIGLLYAPRPGAETRERLREGADRVKDRARFAAGRVRGELESAATQIRERSFASSNEVGQNR